jgi:hypothetical protein
MLLLLIRNTLQMHQSELETRFSEVPKNKNLIVHRRHIIETREYLA